MEERVGTKSAKRYFAANADTVLALICFWLIASQINFLLLKHRNSRADLIAGCAAAACYFLYFWVFEAFTSTTPGKWWFGLIVVRRDGSRCGIWRSFLRTIPRLVETNPIAFGAILAVLSILGTSSRQRLGDILADTVVVEKQE